MYTVHASATPLRAAAVALNTALQHEKENDILLLLSGGSAMVLADEILPKNLSKRVTVTALDERYTRKQSESNFGTLATMPFWKTASDAHVTFIDTRPEENESLKNAALRFDTALKLWHTEHPKGVVVATMGIGPDGHVSGMLPFPEDPDYFKKTFEDTDRFVVGYSVSKEKNPFTERMTTTLQYLEKHVAHAIFYIGDIKKESALQAALALDGNTATTPARLIQNMRNTHLVIPSDMALG